MNTINQFYLKHAVYQVEIDGREIALLLNYAENTYQLIGAKHERIEEIARMLLAKKHAVNFAYKFSTLGGSTNGKIEERDL